MMGFDFATLIGKHLKEPQVITTLNEKLENAGHSNHEIMTNVHLIQSNPEKSKHLETATCRILGFDLDFVNLRSESYSTNSRIPHQIAMGTPLEDALRRDLTINSLFFNVTTGEVEDWTGKGMQDLENGMIRTPLMAEATFHDDPLRILRAIRFASRLRFQLDKDIQNAASNPEVHFSLSDKISRERIGIEIWKMLHGPNPGHAFSLLNHLNIFQTITLGSLHAEDLAVCNFFGAEKDDHHRESTISANDFDFKLSQRAIAAFQWLTSFEPPVQKSIHSHREGFRADPLFLKFPLFRDFVPSQTSYLALFMLPFYKSFCYNPKKMRTSEKIEKNNPQRFSGTLSHHLLKVSLKLPRRQADWVDICHSSLELVQECSLNLKMLPVLGKARFEGEHAQRCALGLLVRRLAQHPVLVEYRTIILIAAAFELSKSPAITSWLPYATDQSTLEYFVATPVERHIQPDSLSSVMSLLQRYHDLFALITHYDLNDAWNVRCILDVCCFCFASEF
jgi:tRNA nucleotidyltransferase/poly(A) polymerase